MNYVKLQNDVLKDFNKYPIKENSLKELSKGSRNIIIVFVY